MAGAALHLTEPQAPEAEALNLAPSPRGVDSKILMPNNTWSDQAEFEKAGGGVSSSELILWCFMRRK